MEKNLVISTVKREAHITVVEVNTKLVARLMEIQCVHRFDPESAGALAILLVKELAEDLGILSDAFFLSLVDRAYAEDDKLSDKPPMP